MRLGSSRARLRFRLRARAGPVPVFESQRQRLRPGAGTADSELRQCPAAAIRGSDPRQRSGFSAACGGRYERPGGDHVQSRPRNQARCPRKGRRSGRHRHRTRHESACPTQVDCRSGHSISFLSSRELGRRPRPHRKSAYESLENCVCLGQGGRQSSEAALARWSDQSLSNQRRLGGIRSGTCDDMEVDQPEVKRRWSPPRPLISVADV